MIRVGFIYDFSDASWFGGLSYFRNLLTAVHSLPDRQVEFVLVVNGRADLELARDWPAVDTVQSPILRLGRPEWFVRRVVRRALSRDLLLERLLRKHGIAALTHSGTLGKNARLPTLGWIPDFQHRHLPQFFSSEDIKRLDREIKVVCDRCTYVLLSSEAARADLAGIDAAAAANAKVLRFVALPDVDVAVDLDYLQQRYAFRGQYFHLPNQFWAHKNHEVVIKALRILKSRGQDVLVLATGNPQDHRQPAHFNDLMAHVDKAGVRDSFKVLGMVPRDDLYGLMLNSVALINPSLFEGWSTTVEEAKSLGKHTILSDLQVHREQAPPGGVYFDPHDPEALAGAMWNLWSSYDKGADEEMMKRARELLPERRKEYARNYERIVAEALKQSQDRPEK